VSGEHDGHDHNHDHDHAPIDIGEHELTFYQKRADVLARTLIWGGYITSNEVNLAVKGFSRIDPLYFESLLNLLIQLMIGGRWIEPQLMSAKLEKLAATDLSDFERRVVAFSEILVERGSTTYEGIQTVTDNLYRDVPGRGPKVVARAWCDPDFKARLLTDARSAIGELGIFLNIAVEPEVRVLENTESVHHVVVCTLCSCYPRMLLGDPPEWYKSAAYKKRIVSEPRIVLGEMGLRLEPQVEIRVLDSTAQLRYLVLPVRPSGTEGLGEEELAALVTRNSMIGVARVSSIQPRST
jgi:nitrile hydratase subunit alpha